MIDPHTFAMKMAVLAEVHRYEYSDVTAQEYYRLLSPRMTTEQFTAAVDALMLDGSKYWPKPGAFLEAIRPTNLGEHVTAGEAWEQVRRIMLGYAPGVSVYDRVAEVRSVVGEAAYRALQMLGGGHRIRIMKEDDEGFVITQFAKYFAEEVREIRREAERHRALGSGVPGPKLLREG